MATQAGRLARTLVDVADTLSASFNVADLQGLIADRCIEILTVDAAGMVLAAPDAELQAVLGPNGSAGSLLSFELAWREGPCIDCFQTGEAVLNQDLLEATARDRWPHFTPIALDHGFATVHALPMRHLDQVIGALALYQSTGILDQPNIEVARALADGATIALLQHRAVSQARATADQLQEALVSRVVIEQAKGVLATVAGLSMDDAFSQLRAYARSNNLPLVEVARLVVDQTARMARERPRHPGAAPLLGLLGNN